MPDPRLILLAAALCAVVVLLTPGLRPSHAADFKPVVDTTAAEAAYAKGDYKEARRLFEAAADAFRVAQKDSLDYHVYREAAYMYDRLADCCFTQRDWDGLKLYVDGLLVVTASERNLAQTALSGALESGISQASARFLAARLDEAVRFATLIQLKRSIALVLVDSRGEGKAGAGAIKQYQELAKAWRGVVSVEQGLYVLEVNTLESRVATFDSIFDAVSALADIPALWQKYEPQAKDKPAEGAGVAEGGAAPAKPNGGGGKGQG